MTIVTKQEGELRWSLPARLFHWIAALLIIVMLGLGLTMTHLVEDSGARFDLYQNHKSLGFCVLAVMLGRVLWRLREKAPPAPAAMPARQVLLAHATHGTLYLGAFAMIFSGWVNESASPLPIPLRFFGLFTLPKIVGPNQALSKLAEELHKYIGWALVALLALHVAAALKHHFIDRDNILRRMWLF